MRAGRLRYLVEIQAQAESRLRHPALKLNLGALLILQDKPEDAAKHLSEAINQPELSLGAYQGLGLAYKMQGKYRQAVKWLMQAIEGVDVAQALTMWIAALPLLLSWLRRNCLPSKAMISPPVSGQKHVSRW